MMGCKGQEGKCDREKAAQQAERCMGPLQVTWTDPGYIWEVCLLTCYIFGATSE